MWNQYVVKRKNKGECAKMWYHRSLAYFGTACIIISRMSRHECDLFISAKVSNKGYDFKEKTWKHLRVYLPN